MTREYVKRWLELIQGVSNSLEPAEALRVLEELEARYCGADRHYHDWRHIQFCLWGLDSTPEHATEPELVELAIWFHDAVYDSRRKDNEQASAELAKEELGKLGVSRAKTERVAELILATRHDVAAGDDWDAALLMDIDLAILAATEDVFDEYEAGVWKEYAWVEEEAFQEGRAKVLRSFLQRARIYQTGFFWKKLEEPARRNLERSIGKLGG